MNGRIDLADLREVLGTPELQKVAESAGVYSSSYEDSKDLTPTVAQRRRIRRSTGTDPVGVASLMVDDEGVLFWNLDGAARSRGAGRRRLRRGVPESRAREIVELYHYDKLEPNDVNTLLSDKDKELTPQQGLWILSQSRLGPQRRPWSEPRSRRPSREKKKRLLFIHGTFSKTEAFFAGMEEAPRRQARGEDAVRSL